MMNFLKTCIIALAFVVPALSVEASSGKGEQPHARAFKVHGHDPIGKPGDGSSFDRTIEISIRETESGYMLFEPDAIRPMFTSLLGWCFLGVIVLLQVVGAVLIGKIVRIEV